MNKIKYLVILFSVIFLMGLVGPPILKETKNTPSYHGKIQALSIIFLGKKFGIYESKIKMSDFNKLKWAFMSAGIKTDLYFFSKHDSNARKHFYKYINMNPYTLIINPVHMTTGNAVDTTYELSLYAIKTQQKIWTAELDVGCGWTVGMFERFEEMGDIILRKLIDNNLINLKYNHKRTHA